MRPICSGLPVLCIVAALVLAGCGDPETPGATTALPTASSTAEPGPRMRISGDVWLNARSTNGINVTAMAGDVECASGSSAIPMDAWIAMYVVFIDSSSSDPACFEPNTTLSFRVEGAPVEAIAIYSPGSEQHIDLFAGPAFARYTGAFADPGDLSSDAHVEAVIDGTVCGTQLNPFQGGFAYDVIVDPEDVTPGCGKPGATVTLELVDAPRRGLGTPVGNSSLAPGQPIQLVEVAWSANQVTKLPDAHVPNTP